MAISLFGQISSDQVYEERYGSTPGSQQNLEKMQDDWNLPETPDNSNIFAGKGRPEGTTDPASGVSEYLATLNGTINNAGGYSSINCDWRFMFDGSPTSTTTVGGTFTGSVSTTVGVNPDTSYSYQLQCRNIHKNGNWITYNTRNFTTQPLQCLIEGTQILMHDGSIKYIEDLKVGERLLSSSIEGLRDASSIELIKDWRSSVINKLNVPGRIQKIVAKQADGVISVNKGALVATGSHTQLIKRKGIWQFISLEEIAVGDLLFHTRDGLIKVEDVDGIQETHNIFKLTMEGPTHTFYANRILTHNIK